MLDVLHQSQCHRHAKIRLEQQLLEPFQGSGLDAAHRDADVHERDFLDR